MLCKKPLMTDAPAKAVHSCSLAAELFYMSRFGDALESRQEPLDAHLQQLRTPCAQGVGALSYFLRVSISDEDGSEHHHGVKNNHLVARSWSVLGGV